MSWPSAMTTTFAPTFSFCPIELLVVLVGDDRALGKVDLVGRAVDRLDRDLVRLRRSTTVPTILNFSWARQRWRRPRPAQRRSTRNAWPHYNPAIMKRILFAVAVLAGLCLVRPRRRKHRANREVRRDRRAGRSEDARVHVPGRRHRHPRQRRGHHARARRDQRQRAAARHRRTRSSRSPRSRRPSPRR